ncbi:hypothetical protein SDC9_127314 [bioreactor metagenome]|uniref:Uncharacterized protein n=1 Tax=bioreactor metagenome TaxID=1076179 RepID=A0A645CTL9_9ZZZZ
MVRIAPGIGHRVLQALVLLLAAFQRRVLAEHHFGPACGECQAATALAGLQNHRIALLRARHRQWPARLEVGADVVQAAHLVGVGIDLGHLVVDDGVVRPGVPVAHDHFHELVGAVIAQIVLQMFFVAEVRGLGIIHRRDHIPRHAALGHQVQRGIETRHMIGLVIGRRIGGAQAQARGGHGHGHQHRGGFQLGGTHAVFHGVAVAVAVDVRNGQAIIEEGHVELALFQRARHALEILRAQRVRHAGRMPPRARVVGAILCLHEGDERHLARGVGHERLSSFVVTGSATTAHVRKYSCKPRAPQFLVCDGLIDAPNKYPAAPFIAGAYRSIEARDLFCVARHFKL